ncbi:LuxR C-terminal-related transcriptional regulator [Streptomyces sp. NPDC002092]
MTMSPEYVMPMPLVSVETQQSVTNLVLADYDPLSRQVLSDALRAASGREGRRLRLLACLDSYTPVETWPGLDHADVVVLAPCPQVDTDATIRLLVARGVRVVLLLARWDNLALNRAMAAGASGCLVKDLEVDRIPAAVQAVASGYALLSAELIALYRPASPHGGHAAADSGKPAGLPLTGREHEVLSLLARGMSTAETARALGVSPTTVKSHVSHALPKLNARNRLEAVLMIKNAD